MLANKVYDVLKWIVVFVLPAIGTCVSALGVLWGWPNTTVYVGTISAITTCLGSIIGLSTINYNTQRYVEGVEDLKEKP